MFNNLGPGLFIQGQLQNLLSSQQQLQFQPMFPMRQRQMQGQMQGQSIPVILPQDQGPTVVIPNPSNRVDSYVHQQSTLATTWFINHNLNGAPVISLYHSQGSQMFADVQILNLNQAIATFSQPTDGFAVVDI